MILKELLQSTSDEAAIAGPGVTSCSHRDLRSRLEQTYQFLRQKGVGRDACVATISPPGSGAATLFLAVANACRCAPLNPSLRPQEIAFVLRDTGARVLIAGEGAPESAIAAARECGVAVLSTVPGESKAGAWTFRQTPALSDPSSDGPPSPGDIALYLHTSGTTARPKLVPLAHSAILDSTQSIVGSLGLGSSDCSLCIMPLFHVHGLIAALLAPLAAGGQVWCAPGFQATRFFGWLKESEATWYTAVPTMHQAILLRSGHQADLRRDHRLRFVRSCSAPLTAAVWMALRDTFGVSVVQAYGMTEAAHQISSSSLADLEDEIGSVGQSTGPKIAIMDADGELHPDGVRGEVVLSGPSIIQRYESPVEANDVAFHGGWFRTGDEGYVDGGGRLRLTGRLKELINAGGEKISPYEVEEVLLSHPAVQEAVVFSIPQSMMGEVVGAAIVLKMEVTEAALRSWLRGRLARHKIPKRIEFVDGLPVGATGKVRRNGMASLLGLAP